MLKWLKQRARHTFYTRFNSLMRRGNHNSNMYYTDDTSYTHTIKLIILSDEGKEYHIDVKAETTIEELKKMAIGKFFTFPEAVKTGKNDQDYQFIVLRQSRKLDSDSTVRLEKLTNLDTLLLVSKRRDPSLQVFDGDESNAENDDSQDFVPTEEQIRHATSHLPSFNNKFPEPLISPGVDYKVELSRILLVLIEISATMIVTEPNYQETFDQIFARMEKRRRPGNLDKKSLDNLTEMGFTIAEACNALTIKKTFDEALNYLLTTSKQGQEDMEVSESIDTQFDEMENNNPVAAFMNRFKQYRRTWCPQDVNKKDAEVPYSRTSSIIIAMIQSSHIQTSLPRPNVLLALMCVCENPNTINVWLSDPDTHNIISQIMWIYHSEKYSKEPRNIETDLVPVSSQQFNIGFEYLVPQLRTGREELLLHYKNFVKNPRRNILRESRFPPMHLNNSSSYFTPTNSHCDVTWNSHLDIFGPIPDYISSNVQSGPAHLASSESDTIDT